MDQQQLSNRLEERVADVPVGAPPIDAMRSAVRRRRGRMAVLGAAAAVAVIAAGGVAWQQVDDPAPQPPAASDPPADPDAPPEGYRYVGIGTAVIAVPEDWGTNDTKCGTPQEDTVLIDEGAICMALFPRPAKVESVQISWSPMPEHSDLWAPFELDGEEALRSPELSTSSLGEAPAMGTTETSASVYLPSQEVLFTAASSSEDASALVDELLSSVTILDDHTAVPGFQEIAFRRGPTPAPPMIETYTTMLERLGLAVEVVTEQSDFDQGTVLATDPAVGSVVAPGDTVRVTVAR